MGGRGGGWSTHAHPSWSGAEASGTATLHALCCAFADPQPPPSLPCFPGWLLPWAGISTKAVRRAVRCPRTRSCPAGRGSSRRFDSRAVCREAAERGPRVESLRRGGSARAMACTSPTSMSVWVCVFVYVCACTRTAIAATQNFPITITPRPTRATERKKLSGAQYDAHSRNMPRAQPATHRRRRCHTPWAARYLQQRSQRRRQRCASSRRGCTCSLGVRHNQG